MPQSTIDILRERFEKNMHRHPHIVWKDVEARLLQSPKLATLGQMESTGGEPDVVEGLSPDGAYVFVDCSRESPAGRRSLCYDREALDGRKENKPKDSVIDMANSFGVTLLDEDEYKILQTIEICDQKTSSWILTPKSVRDLGGAIFCDRRYDRVFTYHNGADSYYAARGWRGKVSI